MTPCMDVYGAKIQSDGILDKLKLRIVVRVYLNDKNLSGYSWSPTTSMKSLKHFFSDTVNHKERLHQLDFIEEFFLAKVKNRVFVNLDSLYAEYFHNIQVTL